MSLTTGFTIGGMQTSRQFSDAIQAVTGDGVCTQRDRLALSVSGFSVSLAPGFALALGRWMKSDTAVQLTLPEASGASDRYDAAVVRVNEAEKTVRLEILPNIDQTAVKENPVIPEENGGAVALYVIRVRRGTTSLSEPDITDVRRTVLPLSEMSAGVLRVYRFTAGGIDIEVERLVEKSAEIVQQGTEAVAALNAAIQNAGGTEVSELMVSAVAPAPAQEWLLCDGSAVPPAYPSLTAVIGGMLPNIPPIGARYKTYIYAGTPAGTEGSQNNA